MKNAVVKQTDAKTAVLTTAAQTAGKEYNVTVNGESVGKFTGVSAVIPTKIDVTTTSVQGVIGEEVTLTAKVTVPQGQSAENVPVTFNIVNNSANNNKIEAEVLTKADGTATYTYTRYYGSEDTFTAYATKKSSVFSTGKVYWANKIQLAVSEITTGNELANNTKKSYKVTGKASTTYYVTVKENIGVTPDKVTQLNVQNAGSSLFVVPAELSTGGNNVVAEVRTDADGEATFTVYGTNLTATPIVYDAKTVAGNLNSAGTLVDDEYSKTALQAEAPAVKFSQVDKLALSVVAEGTANSAEYDVAPSAYDQKSVGGRTYTVTVTDKDGKLAPEGTTAYVTFEDGNFAGDVHFTTAKQNFRTVTKDTPYAITVGKEGKATFRVAGKGATTFAKPTVFLNTAGDVTPVALNKTDIQQVAEATYFKSPVVKNAELTVTDAAGNEITSTTTGTDAYVTYQSVDQNGFAYKPTTANYQLAFDVTSTFGNAIVKDANGTVLNASQNLGNTKTYQVFSNSTGEAVVRVTTTSADTVTVNVTGANGILPTQAATVSFTNTSTAPVATGVVVNVNTDNKKLVIQNATSGAAYTYSYAASNVAQYQIGGVRVDEDTFKAALSTGDTVTATAAADGKYILNIASESGLPTTITSQSAFNQALANGQTSFVLAITDGLTINTTAVIPALNLSGSIAGGLTVNAPNAHVNNGATVTGGVNIIDVAGTSFVNTGSITGDVVITDSNARFVISGAGSLTGKIVIDGTGTQKIVLEGTGSNNIVVGSDVTTLTLTAPNADNTISAESGSTVVTNNGNPVTPGVVSQVGTSGVITLDAPEYIAGPSVTALVKLEDKDLNVSPNTKEKVTVKVTYGTTVTDLVLEETTETSGVFQAYTADLTKGGNLKVSYNDVKTASGTIELKEASAVVYASDVVTFTNGTSFNVAAPFIESHVKNEGGAQVATTASTIQAALVAKLATLQALTPDQATAEGRTLTGLAGVTAADIKVNGENIQFSADGKTVYITGPVLSEKAFIVAKGGKDLTGKYNITLIDDTITTPGNMVQVGKIVISANGSATIVTP